MTYHHIGDAGSAVVTTPDAFDAQLRSFADLGYRSLSMRDLAALLREPAPLPERCVAFTFDDGYASFLREAWPRLQHYGFTATLFIATALTGSPALAARGMLSAPLLSWSEVAELARQGCEIGGHGRTHRPLVTLDPAELESEIAGCSDDIQEHLGTKAAAFAYPFGAFDSAGAAVASRYFELALTTRLGYAETTSPHARIPRIDACYLTPPVIRRLSDKSFRHYLHLRQIGRSIRRMWRKDWE